MLRPLVFILPLVLACASKPDAKVSDSADASVSSTTTAAFDTTKSNDVSPHSYDASVTTQTPSSASTTTDDVTTSTTGTSSPHTNDDTATPPDQTPDADVDSSDPAQSAGDAGADRAISCDPRKLVCRRAEPACDYGFVPRIVEGCYGDCVAIDTCVCDGPEACPHEERYTCNNSRQRCTPYLN